MSFSIENNFDIDSLSFAIEISRVSYRKEQFPDDSVHSRFTRAKHLDI